MNRPQHKIMMNIARPSEITDILNTLCVKDITGMVNEYVNHELLDIQLKKYNKIHDFRLIHYQSPEICMQAIKLNPEALKHVKNQTKKLCMEAVMLDGIVLRVVRNQTEDICIAAVSENGYALQFVKKQTPEICMAAVKQNPSAAEYININM